MHPGNTNRHTQRGPKKKFAGPALPFVVYETLPPICNWAQAIAYTMHGQLMSAWFVREKTKQRRQVQAEFQGKKYGLALCNHPVIGSPTDGTTPMHAGTMHDPTWMTDVRASFTRSFCFGPFFEVSSAFHLTISPATAINHSVVSSSSNARSHQRQRTFRCFTDISIPVYVRKKYGTNETTFKDRFPVDVYAHGNCVEVSRCHGNWGG